MTKCTRCGKENPAEVHTCTPPLALRLADALDAECAAREEIFRTRYKEFREAAAELRRQYEANSELIGTLKHARDLVAEWGANASDHIQTKHGLALDLKQLDAAIRRWE